MDHRFIYFYLFFKDYETEYKKVTVFIYLTIFVSMLCSGTALSPTSLQHGHSRGFLTNYTKRDVITEDALWIIQPVSDNSVHLGKW